MRLKQLALYCGAKDLSPLKNLPLEDLAMIEIPDPSILDGMKLKTLHVSNPSDKLKQYLHKRPWIKFTE